MWPIFQRIVLPALAVLAGVAAVIHGAKYHSVPLAQTELEERDVEVERVKWITDLAPAGFGSGDFPWGETTPSEAQGEQPAEPQGDQPLEADGQSPEETPAENGEMEGPPPPPGMKYVKRKVTYTETEKQEVTVTKVNEVLEPALVFEVTIGGVIRKPGDEHAELWRTYSSAAGEAPPSLCPT
jgi:hypothetical protein